MDGLASYQCQCTTTFTGQVCETGQCNVHEGTYSLPTDMDIYKCNTFKWRKGHCEIANASLKTM